MAPYIKHLQLGCMWFHLAQLNNITYTHEYKIFTQLATVEPRLTDTPEKRTPTI